jgi:signal recognition particle subunit SRP9
MWIRVREVGAKVESLRVLSSCDSFLTSDHNPTTKVVYIALFEDYLTACARLYNESGKRCRFVVKYRNADGHVVLKLTDDVLCFKFKTDQRAALVHVAQINGLLMTAMSTGSKVALPPANASGAASAFGADADAQAQPQ